jgi:hypothetical protein
MIARSPASGSACGARPEEIAAAYDDEKALRRSLLESGRASS